MGTKIFLEVLLLSGIFFQGSESLSERNIDASSDRHVRQKRIIDTFRDRDDTVFRQEVPYVVLFINQRGSFHCTGIILKARIILTAAHCVVNFKVFIVIGGRVANNAKSYNIVEQYVHEGFDPDLLKNDLALVIIDEPIDLVHSYHRPIELYEGHLPPNSHGLVSGWGCVKRGTKKFPKQALSISVPILSQAECQTRYGLEKNITSHEICTYYTNRTKCCWFGDSGGPLAVNGYLVGVMSSFRSTDETEYPDIFMNVMESGYKMWVEAWVNHFLSRYQG